MKIFGIMLVKNEGDIIGFTLERALESFDGIFVFDNGSNDTTWDLVREAAEADPRVVPYKSSSEPFRDSLRSDVFNAFSNQASEGDWWCRLDGDEVYLDDPREFLKSVPARHHVVWTEHLQFYLTEEDVARLGKEVGPPPIMTSETLPRYYRCNFSEARFFRHRNSLVWDATSWPSRMGVVTPRRIRVCHYQYRSPQQLEMRLATRKEAAATGWEHFKKDEHKSGWRDGLVDSSTLHLFEPSKPVIVEDCIAKSAESWHRQVLKSVYYLIRK